MREHNRLERLFKKGTGLLTQTLQQQGQIGAIAVCIAQTAPINGLTSSPATMGQSSLILS